MSEMPDRNALAYLLSNQIGGHRSPRECIDAIFKHLDPCLDKVQPGEPVFVLRAHDALAPKIVRLWAQEASRAGSPADKVEEALLCAKKMMAWQNLYGLKVPD